MPSAQASLTPHCCCQYVVETTCVVRQQPLSLPATHGPRPWATTAPTSPHALRRCRRSSSAWCSGSCGTLLPTSSTPQKATRWDGEGATAVGTARLCSPLSSRPALRGLRRREPGGPGRGCAQASSQWSHSDALGHLCVLAVLLGTCWRTRGPLRSAGQPGDRERPHRGQQRPVPGGVRPCGHLGRCSAQHVIAAGAAAALQQPAAHRGGCTGALPPTHARMSCAPGLVAGLACMLTGVPSLSAMQCMTWWAAVWAPLRLSCGASRAAVLGC